jgi:hypothetical protein
MKNDSRNLNIPLERNENWGLKLLMAAVLAIGISWIFNPTFAIVLTASCIVGLPVFWLFLFSKFFGKRILDFSQVGGFLLLFAYIALSKKVLIPIVSGVIERVFL